MVPDPGTEDGTLPRIEHTTELSILAGTDAPASTMAGGQGYLADVAQRLAPSFARLESRHRAQAYLRGVRSAAERKNSGPLAEVGGESTPYGFQYVLNRADWDADAVRDELRRSVI